MKISLPYSRKRRYLTGIDWFVGTLAHTAQKNYRVGGISQAILEVEGTLSEKVLRTILDQLSRKFPLLHGRVARDWLNLAPFWKVPPQPDDTKIPLKVIDLTAEQSHQAEGLFSEHVNTPFDSPWQHVRFLLVRIGSERSQLALAFDHRLFDAYGSELFFQLMDQAWQSRLEEIAPRIKQTEPAHLDLWKRRFASGRRLNDFLEQMNKRKVCGLPMPRDGVHRPIRFVYEKLSSEESAAFNRRAVEEIAMPIILPAATARAMLAMQRVFPSPPLEGEQYLAFTSANMRTPAREWESFFFNHFSLLPFSMEVAPQRSAREVAISLRDQFFERMKEQIPFAMQDAMMLGRICPLAVGSKLLQFVTSRQLCSFYFACLRETGFSASSFMGLKTTNLIHQPLVFSPPGLNICMTSFHGAFNLVISYVDGVTDDASAHRLMREFKSLLLS